MRGDYSKKGKRLRIKRWTLLLGACGLLMSCEAQQGESEAVSKKLVYETEKAESSGEAAESEGMEQRETQIVSETGQQQTQTANEIETQTESVSEVQVDVGQEIDLSISAQAYCVMDKDSGEVLFSHNGLEERAPASITKVVTALAVVRHCEDLDRSVTITDEMYDDIDLLSSTITPALKIGEQISVRDLLYGMALSSGNECASALAVYTAGSVAAFANWMNEIVREVGAVGCHFVDAHGLDREEHYVSAVGMTRLWRAALENEEVRTLFSAQSWTISATNLTGARNLTVTNQFLNGTYALSGVYAGKTGYTPNAEATLVTAMEQNGRNLLITVLGSEVGKSYEDTEALASYVATSEQTDSLYGVRISEQNAEGFTVTANVSPYITSGQIAIWSKENGQDDVRWLDATVSDGTLRAFVSAQPELYDMAVIGKNESTGKEVQQVVTVLVSGEAYGSGFYDWNGKKWMIEANGTCSQGWFEDNVNHCYSDGNGLFQEGVLQVGENRYFFRDYQIVSGWIEDGEKRYYALPTGVLATGRIFLRGMWENFDENGIWISQE